MSETWAANTTTSSATCVSADTWHHIAWVRNGSAVNLYVDGVSRVSATWSTNYTSTTVAIGSRYHTSPLSYFKGYIQSPRITYSAVYTADFTPPTTPFAPYLYGVAGSVTESLAIEDWVVSSHRADTAALLQQATVYQDKTYAVSSAGVLVPVYVACRPRITGKWVANTAYAARAIIAPTDPVTTPYIFKCTTAGTSHGTTEPIWDTTAGNITSDGSAVWTSLGRLPQAILHGPLIPS
jgi:hypothetical protein